MRLVTACRNDSLATFVGAVTSSGKIANLTAASKVLDDVGSGLLLPADMIAFLRLEQRGFEQAKSLLAALDSADDESLVYAASDVKMFAPVPRPGKILHTSVNFGDHLSELTQWSGQGWEEHGWGEFHYEHPTGFLQAPSAVTGPDSTVVRPKFTKELDYEIELAIIIGKEAKYVSRTDALDYVAGYSIFNDISARDIQSREHANNVILLGKSFDTSAPFGPYLVTPDEIDDPQDMPMQLRVNGELRQNASTRDMHFKIRDLVSWWSNITLEPGDVITSGSPAGVAAGMDQPRYLDAGDEVEARIGNLGTLTVKIAVE